MGVPDLSEPPVILTLPPEMPITDESRTDPILAPSSGCADLSLSSCETLLPVESEMTNLNCAIAKSRRLLDLINLWLETVKRLRLKSTSMAKTEEGIECLRCGFEMKNMTTCHLRCPNCGMEMDC